MAVRQHSDNNLEKHITSLLLASEKKCLRKMNANYEWIPELAKAGT